MSCLCCGNKKLVDDLELCQVCADYAGAENAHSDGHCQKNCPICAGEGCPCRPPVAHPHVGGGYENAPATQLLATHCAVCSRPLLDAKSVELGIGPDCRRKYGFDVEVDEAARAEANKLVHEVARGVPAERLAQVAARLGELGLVVLSAKLVEGATKLVVEEAGGELVVRTPFSPDFAPALKSACSARGVRAAWDAAAKRWRVPVAGRLALWAALKRVFPGQLGVGPRGAFVCA